MSPTLAVLPGVTLVLVSEPILSPSSNPALRWVNLEVVGEPTLYSATAATPVGVETYLERHMRLSRQVCVSGTHGKGERRLVSVKRAFLIYECLYPLVVHRMHLAVCMS